MIKPIDRKSEISLYMMSKYGLRPPVKELEELAINDLIEINNEDGWIITVYGYEYLRNVEVRKT